MNTSYVEISLQSSTGLNPGVEYESYTDGIEFEFYTDGIGELTQNDTLFPITDTSVELYLENSTDSITRDTTKICPSPLEMSKSMDSITRDTTKIFPSPLEISLSSRTQLGDIFRNYILVSLMFSVEIILFTPQIFNQ